MLSAAMLAEALFAVMADTPASCAAGGSPAKPAVVAASGAEAAPDGDPVRHDKLLNTATLQ